MAILNQSNLYASGESVTASNLNALIGQATFSTNNGEAVDGSTLQVHSTDGYLMVKDGGITSTKLAAGAVDASAIGTGAITSTQLASNSVTSSQIASSAVTSAKLANDAVTADKLAHTAVTPGSYTNTDITVDQQGRITAAANGTAGSTISKYSTGWVTSIGGTTVANNAQLSVTHNLNTADYIAQVWATSNPGLLSGQLLLDGDEINIVNINNDAITLDLFLGNGYRLGAGSLQPYTNAYLKVVIIG